MNENDYPIPASTEPTPFLTEKRWILFIYLPIFLIATLTFSMFFDERSGVARAVDLISAIGVNIFAFAWCRIDSRERSYELHRLFTYFIVIFGFIAVTYYLFRSRGFTGGIRSFGWMLLYSVLLILTTMIIVGGIMTILVMTGVAPPSVFN